MLERTSSIDQVREYAIWDIHDWVEDAGAAVRDFTRRLDGLERFAIARMGGDEPLPRAGGVFVLRATTRNRRLVSEHRAFFERGFQALPRNGSMRSPIATRNCHTLAALGMGQRRWQALVPVGVRRGALPR